MEIFVRKHIGYFLKSMVVRQLGRGRGNMVLILILFSILIALKQLDLLIIAALKTEA